MISLFRKKRLLNTEHSAESVIDRLYSLNNKFISKTKFVEVRRKGARTFGLSFDKNIASSQLNYSVSKEIWIESIDKGSKVHIKTRPIGDIWAFLILMLPMIPNAIYESGLQALLMFIGPLCVLEVLFLHKSTSENSKLDKLINEVLM